jgi:hypothetical protein
MFARASDIGDALPNDLPDRPCALIGTPQCAVGDGRGHRVIDVVAGRDAHASIVHRQCMQLFPQRAR